MTDIDTQFLRSLFDKEGSLHTAGRTALYRLHGPQGLLYVGISTCPPTRIPTPPHPHPRGPPAPPCSNSPGAAASSPSRSTTPRTHTQPNAKPSKPNGPCTTSSSTGPPLP